MVHLHPVSKKKPAKASLVPDELLCKLLSLIGKQSLLGSKCS